MRGIRRFIFNKTYNVRDLGGYYTASGRVTSWKAFIRGDFPDLDENEIKFLLNYGLRNVLDLREENEAERRPSVFNDYKGVAYKNISLISSVEKKTYTEDTRLVDQYKHLLHERDSMKKIFSALAAWSKGTVFFHCSGGKDRTGIVSALLLLLAGVHDEDIVADYQISYTYLYPAYKTVKREELEYPLQLYYTEPEYMREFLDYLRECFVTVDVYMDYLGISRNQVEALRIKMLE